MTNIKLNLVVIGALLILSSCYAPYSQDIDGGIMVIEVEHPLNESDIVNTTETINKTVNKVIITNRLTFDPFELTINVNDTVTWMNEDDWFNRAHIIYDLKRKWFRSSRLTYGQQFEYTFTEPGIYEYTDAIFPEEMGRAKIIVR